MKPLGLGIIGLHHQHPRWYHPLWSHLSEYSPVAVAEGDEAFLAEENEFFNLDPYTDYHELLGREDVDVVILFLPHTQMPEAVAAAAEAGKHVIVEKPCAANVDGVQSIAETARRFPHIKISAPYVWRTHPVSEKIYSAVDSGMLGRITDYQGARCLADAPGERKKPRTDRIRHSREGHRHGGAAQCRNRTSLYPRQRSVGATVI